MPDDDHPTGEPLDMPPPEGVRRCWRCRTPIPAGASKCPGCGAMHDSGPVVGSQPPSEDLAVLTDGENGVSTALYLLGALAILGGLIGAIVVATQQSYDLSSGSYDRTASAITVALTGLTSGLLLVGVGKLIIYAKAAAIYLRRATQQFD